MQANLQSFQPQRVAQQNVNADPTMDKFMDRFSNDEYLQQQRLNVKKLQEQILRQQIHEKKMRQIQEKQMKQVEKVKYNN